MIRAFGLSNVLKQANSASEGALSMVILSEKGYYGPSEPNEH